MRDFLNNIKRDLNEISSEHVMITLERKDIEMLVKAYEKKSELLKRKSSDNPVY